MGKKMKSYLVFTSPGYRIWTLLIFPVLLFFSSWIASDWGMYLMGSFFVFVEILSDYWIFGGICNRQMEYLKTSFCGFSVLRDALAGDLIRKFLYLFVCAAIFFVKGGQSNAFSIGLQIYLMAVFFLNGTRYLPGVILQLAVASIASALFSLYGLVARNIHGGAVELLLLLIAAAAVSVVSVWHVLYRMKRSYYEKETENGN